MSRVWQRVQLGSILRERQETPDENEIARGNLSIVSKICFSTGLVELRTVAGTRTKMILVRPGDLLVSGINAIKGAIAVYAESNVSPAAATIHYSAYEVDKRRADVNYLWWFFRSEEFRKILQDALPGGIKTELKAARFLRLEVPLPTVEEQRRIVARIENLSSQVSQISNLRRETSQELKDAIWSAKLNAFPPPGEGKLGDYVRFQVGYSFKSEWFVDQGIRLVRNVNIGHGKIDWLETARIPADRLGEFSRFELQEGDILVSLDRPIISTGVKVARVSKNDLPCLLLQRVARAQIDKGILDPDYLFAWLSSPHYVMALDPGRSNGVPHVSHRDLEKIPFSLPALTTQRRIVDYLNKLQTKVELLEKLILSSAEESDALRMSILDGVLKGES